MSNNTTDLRDECMEFNNVPSEWSKYRCRSCDHTDWVEDIVVKETDQLRLPKLQRQLPL